MLDILGSSIDGNVSVLILLGLLETFDTISHGILLDRLRELGLAQ